MAGLLQDSPSETSLPVGRGGEGREERGGGEAHLVITPVEGPGGIHEHDIPAGGDQVVGPPIHLVHHGDNHRPALELPNGGDLLTCLLVHFPDLLAGEENVRCR